MNSKWIIALVAAGAMAVGCQNNKKSSTSPSMNGSALNVPAAAPAPAMAYTPPAPAQPVIADAPIQPTASAADVPADDIASSPTPAASPAPKRAISSSRARTASAKTASGTHYTINAPALVQDRAARDVYLAHDHNRLVWSLFESLDLAFIGIGSLKESAFIDRGVLAPPELESLRAQGAVGEICGRFFDARGRECKTPHRDRVVSIDLDVRRSRPERSQVC